MDNYCARMPSPKERAGGEASFVIGVDFGTDSCRAVIVDAASGNGVSSSVSHYRRWRDGLYCNPQANQYRQHPQDYIDALVAAVRGALAKAPEVAAANVMGMAFDTTGSTPTLTDINGVPLALLPKFTENPNAMFVLWKDHTAVAEAAEINRLAGDWDVNYTAYCGGIYSSEWVWAKMLHVLREDGDVREAAYSWTELCDWIPALLTGCTKPEAMMRSRCAAGHKAMWHADWNGLPSQEFLSALSPMLDGYRAHLYSETWTGDSLVGGITPYWAEQFGLTIHTAIAVGTLDCHAGAVGAQIAPGIVVRVVGTSTCDIMVAPSDEIGDKLIPGICGQVDGSVIPRMIGFEAGQAAFGDIYAWFRRVLAWPVQSIIAQSKLLDEATRAKLIEEALENILPELTHEAEKIPISDSAVVATDWMNGRRTPDADELLTGTIAGLTLGSTAPMIFRALVEATAFGAKAIVERIVDNGITVREMTAIGGIAQKSPFVMQTLANVLGIPIKVSAAEQACALGAAMFAAVAAGICPCVEDAQRAMGHGVATVYHHDAEAHRQYAALYQKYRAIGKLAL